MFFLLFFLDKTKETDSQTVFRFIHSGDSRKLADDPEGLAEQAMDVRVESY